MKEAYRRARHYCDDYGTLGVRFLAFSAMYVRYREIRGIDAVSGLQVVLKPIGVLWSQLKESAMLSMDRSSGLGLMLGADTLRSLDAPWGRTLARNVWLCSYLHLLARPDIVESLAVLGSSPLADPWWRCLPFHPSAVSALRATLSSARPERDEEEFNKFLNCISLYVKVSHRELFFPRCLAHRTSRSIGTEVGAFHLCSSFTGSGKDGKHAAKLMS